MAWPFCCCCCAAAPPPPVLRIHLDADRDGVVDGNPSDTNWTAGAGNTGAVIIPNIDDDNGTRAINVNLAAVEDMNAGGNATLDGHNVVVDGGGDAELAPLRIQRHPALGVFPAGWTARLTVDKPDYIRIFEPQLAGNPIQRIGPGAATWTLPIATAQINLRMEATGFPDEDFDGLITLTVDVLSSWGFRKSRHRAVVRVAPWILPDHTCEVTEIFVLGKVGIDAHFAEGAAPPYLAAVVAKQAADTQFNTDLGNAVTANGAAPNVTTLPGADYRYDRWCRDVMSIGYTSWPAAGPNATHLPVVMRTPSDRAFVPGRRALDRAPWRVVAGADVGFTAPVFPLAAYHSQNHFGNLMTSPSVNVRGKDYPFGRLIYGSSGGPDVMNPRLVSFLVAQAIQEPFVVDTSWLFVGHVDEAFTFLPTPGVAPGFKVLIASPQEAIDTMRRVRTTAADAAEAAAIAANGALGPLGALAAGVVARGAMEGQVDAYPFFHGLPAGSAPLGDYPRQTLGAFLGDAALVNHQAALQGTIDAVRDVLIHELDITNAEFIRIPVLFRLPNPQGKSKAYTADSVNSLVVTKANGFANIVMPKPYGPWDGAHCIFETRIEALLGAGLAAGGAGGGNVEWVNDFTTYHIGSGEIHCGTNEKRTPTNRRWWETAWI